MSNTVFVAMSRRAEPDSGLSKGIRKQIGSEMTTRFLRSLPMFRSADNLPDDLRGLLDRLEAQEAATERPEPARLR